jgi:hypothetical protein
VSINLNKRKKVRDRERVRVEDFHGKKSFGSQYIFNIYLLVTNEIYLLS